MTRICRGFIAALVLGSLFVALTGCQKKEGPAERAGKEMDKAAEKTGQQIDKVGEKIHDAVKDIKK